MIQRSPLPLIACVATALLLSAASSAQEGTKNVIPYMDEQPVRAQHGMVVSVHHLASDAGLEVLRAGGNAVDAAVATGFALAVVHPAAGNLGGGGFMLVRTHDGHATFIDYREKAPLAATESMYQDSQGNVLPAENLQSSVIGYRSIATPGSVAGLVYAERKYGKLGLARVMAPAIKVAAEGFVLTDEEAKELTDSDLAKFPDSKRIFQRDGQLYKEGETFRQPELARTLQRIATDPDDFYRGKMAHELIDELKKGGALLTLDDLAQYTVVERTPVTGSFHNYTVISAPPPSSGGIVLLSALNVLEGFDLTKLGDRTAQSIHLITEAYRRAYMDRSDYLGDPDYNDIPTAALTAKPYAEAWRKTIEADAATPSATLVRPAGFLPGPPKTAGRRKPESHDTTHYSVVDGEGNAVSVTTTLNDVFGSHVTAGSLGFLLNDEMDDFASKMGAQHVRPHSGSGQRHCTWKTVAEFHDADHHSGRRQAALRARLSGRCAHYHHRGQHLSLRRGRRPEHPASRGGAPFPSPVPAGQALPRAWLFTGCNRRPEEDGLFAEHPRRPLVERGMHRCRSQIR